MDETFPLAVLQGRSQDFVFHIENLCCFFLKMMQLPTVASIPFSSFLYSTVLLLCCIFLYIRIMPSKITKSLADIYTYYIDRLHCCCLWSSLLYYQSIIHSITTAWLLYIHVKFGLEEELFRRWFGRQSRPTLGRLVERLCCTHRQLGHQLSSRLIQDMNIRVRRKERKKGRRIRSLDRQEESGYSSYIERRPATRSTAWWTGPSRDFSSFCI